MSFTKETQYWKGRADLSPRQHEVLRNASYGHTNREIADLLGISEHTVKRHMRWATLKLGARTRAQAVAIAYHQRLLP